MPGKLYVVATPIGNLGDFSPRAADTLREADFIAAEDTRVSAKLLSAFAIKKPQISYYEHNRRQKGEQIAARLLAGESCALITDAGTPAISDPGCDLVALCHQSGIEVIAVPGCSALVAALSISGIGCGRFCFEGFLSTNGKARREHLQSLQNETRAIVFYEAPHKLLRTLSDLLTAFGEREIALCREITKLHEQVLRTTLSQAIAHFTQTAPRGEFVLVLAGALGAQAAGGESVDYVALVGELIASGAGLMDAVKSVAREHCVPKNRLYAESLELFGKKED